MGGAVSENVLNDVINIINSVAIKSSNNCTHAVSEDLNLTIVDSKVGGSIDLFGVDFSQALLVKQNCITSAKVYTSSNQKLNQVITQIAKALVQALGIGVADTKNIAHVLNNIRNRVSEAFEQTCKTQLHQGLSVQIDGSGDIFLYDVDFSQTVEDISECILNIVSTDQSVQDLSQKIAQKATSEVEGLLGPLMAIVIIIVIIIGGLIMKGGSIATSPKFWITLISVVLVYLGLAHTMSWKPFSSGTTTNANSKV